MSHNIEDLVIPALSVLTELFQSRGDLIETSEILDSEALRDIDLGRLLKGQFYNAYTDFVFTTSCEQFNQARLKLQDL